jgi:hypothetical protein
MVVNPSLLHHNPDMPRAHKRGSHNRGLSSNQIHNHFTFSFDIDLIRERVFFANLGKKKRILGRILSFELPPSKDLQLSMKSHSRLLVGDVSRDDASQFERVALTIYL